MWCKIQSNEKLPEKAGAVQTPGRKQDEQENGDRISTDEYDGSDVRHGHVRHEFLRGKISEDSVCGMDCVK